MGLWDVQTDGIGYIKLWNSCLVLCLTHQRSQYHLPKSKALIQGLIFKHLEDSEIQSVAAMPVVFDLSREAGGRVFINFEAGRGAARGPVKFGFSEMRLIYLSLKADIRNAQQTHDVLKTQYRERGEDVGDFSENNLKQLKGWIDHRQQTHSDMNEEELLHWARVGVEIAINRARMRGVGNDPTQPRPPLEPVYRSPYGSLASIDTSPLRGWPQSQAGAVAQASQSSSYPEPRAGSEAQASHSSTRLGSQGGAPAGQTRGSSSTPDVGPDSMPWIHRPKSASNDS